VRNLHVSLVRNGAIIVDLDPRHPAWRAKVDELKADIDSPFRHETDAGAWIIDPARAPEVQRLIAGAELPAVEVHSLGILADRERRRRAA